MSSYINFLFCTYTHTHTGTNSPVRTPHARHSLAHRFSVHRCANHPDHRTLRAHERLPRCAAVGAVGLGFCHPCGAHVAHTARVNIYDDPLTEITIDEYVFMRVRRRRRRRPERIMRQKVKRAMCTVRRFMQRRRRQRFCQ